RARPANAAATTLRHLPVPHIEPQVPVLHPAELIAVVLGRDGLRTRDGQRAHEGRGQEGRDDEPDHDASPAMLLEAGPSRRRSSATGGPKTVASLGEAAHAQLA